MRRRGSNEFRHLTFSWLTLLAALFTTMTLPISNAFASKQDCSDALKKLKAQIELPGAKPIDPNALLVINAIGLLVEPLQNPPAGRSRLRSLFSGAPKRITPEIIVSAFFHYEQNGTRPLSPYINSVVYEAFARLAEFDGRFQSSQRVPPAFYKPTQKFLSENAPIMDALVVVLQQEAPSAPIVATATPASVPDNTPTASPAPSATAPAIDPATVSISPAGTEITVEDEGTSQTRLTELRTRFRQQFPNHRIIIPTQQESAQLADASDHFLQHWDETFGALLERDFLRRPLAYTFLSRGNASLVGPPGTAKTTLAKLLLGRLRVGDTQAFIRRHATLNMNPLSAIVGQIDIQALQQGKMRRLYEDGILQFPYAFIDEFWDTDPALLRALLTILEERIDSSGASPFIGKTRVIVLASNKFVPQIFDKFDDPGAESPSAILDRLHTVALVTQGYRQTASREALPSLAERIKSLEATPSSLTEIDIAMLHELRSRIVFPSAISVAMGFPFDTLSRELNAARIHSLNEYLDQKTRIGTRSIRSALPPIMPAKLYTDRTNSQAIGMLPSIVLYEWIRLKGKRPLRVLWSDIEKLDQFYPTIATEPDHLQSIFDTTLDRYQRSQILTVQAERKALATAKTEHMDAWIKSGALAEWIQIEGRLKNSSPATRIARLPEVFEFIERHKAAQFSEQLATITKDQLATILAVEAATTFLGETLFVENATTEGPQ